MKQSRRHFGFPCLARQYFSVRGLRHSDSLITNMRGTISFWSLFLLGKNEMTRGFSGICKYRGLLFIKPYKFFHADSLLSVLRYTETYGGTSESKKNFYRGHRRDWCIRLSEAFFVKRD